MIKIAIDAMGSDNGSKVVCEAIKNFLKDVPKRGGDGEKVSVDLIFHPGIDAVDVVLGLGKRPEHAACDLF